MNDFGFGFGARFTAHSEKCEYFQIEFGAESAIISLPFDWRSMHGLSRHWMQNFISLRWISKLNPEQKMRVLNDFYEFNFVRFKNNPWVHGVRAGGITSIRLDILSKIYRLKKYELEEDLKKIIAKILMKDIKISHDSVIHEVGHNHGLMLDISVLRAINRIDILKTSSNRKLILDRAKKTSESIFDSNGFSKEHSISYQFYNYILINKLCDQLRRGDEHFSYFKNLNARAEILSRRIYSESLRSDGSNFPIGDSHRFISPKMEKYILSSENFPLIKNRFFRIYNRSLAIFKYKIENFDIHFTTTCCHFSNSHKQNDEFSFCLDINGNKIFDEVGYLNFFGKDLKRAASSEYYHSTFTIKGMPWGPVNSISGGSEIKRFYRAKRRWFIDLVHKRINECISTRKFYFIGKKIYIKDIFVGKKFPSKIEFETRFVLGGNVYFKIEGNLVNLFMCCRKICELKCRSDCIWEHKEIFLSDISKYNLNRSNILICSVLSDAAVTFEVTPIE